MHPTLAHTLLLLLLFSSFVTASTNFDQCLEDLRNDPDAVGLTDYKGYPTSPAQAEGISYKTCKARCESGFPIFDWRNFMQSFATWLLPWLALLSQLPFGSGNSIDDSVSVIMSVGSPAVVAYSLALTTLNTQSVYRRAMSCMHESSLDVAKGLVTLQQIPLELTDDKRLLVFIPFDHHWRQEIVDRLYRVDAWSVATGTSVAWVVIAFIFTLINSFLSLGSPVLKTAEGQPVGTLWLWLLCLVIGWQWVPTFTSGELRRAISYANRQAVKEAIERFKKSANKAMNGVATKYSRRASDLKQSSKPSNEDTAKKYKEKEGSIQENIKSVEEELDSGMGSARELADHQSAPSPERSPKSDQGHNHLDVGENQIANSRVVTVDGSVAQISVCTERDRLFLLKDRCPLNKDEFRASATFNYSRVMRYLVFVDKVFGVLDALAREREDSVSELSIPWLTTNPIFPPGALITMLVAFIAAVVLQFGIAATATIIVYYTPTVGVGCRSLGYMLYGALSIIILALTVISTISARISETRRGRSPFVEALTASVAIALRRICLVLAVINMTGLIALSCLQLAGALINCYCEASAIGCGKDSYVVVSYFRWIGNMRMIRAIAIASAGVTMLLYMTFLWFASVVPAGIDRL